MAAVKPAVKKPVTRGNAPGSSNPNTALVVFLVLFVLASIGLGVWGYYAQTGQDELKVAAIKKGVEVKVMEKKKDLYSLASWELRLAMGQSLDAKEEEDWKILREDVMKEGGKFQDDPLRAVIITLTQDLKKDLTFDGTKYTPSYKDRLAALGEEVKTAKATATEKIAAEARAREQLGLFTKSLDASQKKSLDMILEGNNAALAAARARTKEMSDLIDRNKKLTDAMAQQDSDFKNKTDDLDRAIDVLKGKLEKALDKKDVGVAAANPKAEGAVFDAHALMLDISGGKPLWDVDIGRIVRVIDGKQVVINLGTDDNIKPQLSFNVFLPGKDGRPEREMKGTIEVVRTITAKTALCNITSQTNPDFPIKADDALYNPFFGAHVAIAGQVNWFSAGGVRGESPDEQVRSLNQFMQLLKNQGVVIDAYVDLGSGAIKGSINSRTRYLIKGDNLYVKAMPAEPEPKEPPAKDPPPKEEEKKEEKKDEDKKDEKKDDKEPKKDDAKPMPKEDGDEPMPPLAGLNTKRIQAVNESIKNLRREAIENGSFIISTTNFAVVCGYRRLVTTIAAEEPPFRPSLPASKLKPGSAPPAGNLYGGQKTCPVLGNALGSMGPPPSVVVMGTTIYVCCEGCIDTVKGNPELYLKKVKAETGK